MNKKIPRYHLIILQNYLSYLLNNDHDFLLDPYYIYDYQLNTLYLALKEIKEKGLSKDTETILIESNKIKDDVFNSDFINSLKEKELPENYNIKTEEEQIKYLYHKNKVADDVLSELAEVSLRGGGGDWGSLLKLADKIKSTYSEVNRVEEILSFKEMAFHYFDYRSKPNETKRTYGSKEIDSFFPNPLEPKQCSLLVGNTGSGKSTLALTMENWLIEKNIPVISINLEENRETILEKLICLRAGMTLYEIETITQNKRNQLRFQTAVEDLMDKKNYVFYDKLGISLNDLEAIIIASKKKFLDLGVIQSFDDFIFIKIDLVTRLKDFRGKVGTEIEEPANKIFEMVQKYNMHALLVLQANENEFRSGKKPKSISECDNFMLVETDIKNGSALAEISRAIFTLNRPLFLKYKFLSEELRPDFEDDPDLIVLSLVKNNRGKLGKIKFLFDPETFQIKPFIEERKTGYQRPEQKQEIKKETLTKLREEQNRIENSRERKKIEMNY